MCVITTPPTIHYIQTYTYIHNHRIARMDARLPLYVPAKARLIYGIEYACMTTVSHIL